MEVAHLILKILLVLAILFQLAASIYAVRLVSTTRYNAIWILFICAFFLLSAERTLQFIWLSTEAFPMQVSIWFGVVVSIGLSVGVMYAHKLFRYIDRLNRHRQLVNKRILTAVLRAEERSRSHVAKELHDGLGPLLSSAKMSLSALSREGMSPEQRRIFEGATYAIDESIRSVREISNNMSPHVLNDFGLARGVQNFINKCASMHTERIRFTTNLREERFDKDVEVILYRVICELINNSLKHAACHEMELELTGREDELLVSYSDDGRGFDPEAMMECGMGLSNIHSRIESLGGELHIESSPGRGMRARVRILLSEAAAGPEQMPDEEQ